jgi:hypothetical protein
LTRIEFADPVGRIIHRLRESLIEVIGFKTPLMTADEGIRDDQAMTPVTE